MRRRVHHAIALVGGLFAVMVGGVACDPLTDDDHGDVDAGGTLGVVLVLRAEGSDVTLPHALDLLPSAQMGSSPAWRIDALADGGCGASGGGTTYDPGSTVTLGTVSSDGKGTHEKVALDVPTTDELRLLLDDAAARRDAMSKEAGVVASAVPLGEADDLAAQLNSLAAEGQACVLVATIKDNGADSLEFTSAAGNGASVLLGDGGDRAHWLVVLLDS